VVQIAVMAPGSFRIRSVMNGKDIGVFTRADFARGISIDLPGPVELLEVSTIP